MTMTAHDDDSALEIRYHIYSLDFFFFELVFKDGFDLFIIHFINIELNEANQKQKQQQQHKKKKLCLFGFTLLDMCNTHAGRRKNIFVASHVQPSR